MARLTYDEAHAIARAGPPAWGYRLLRILLLPFLRVALAMRITGTEHVPRKGAVLIVPNHKSYLDGFLLAGAAPRRVFFMAKAEIFEGALGRLLLSLGGFPVRRGQSDGAAIETAQAILRRGDALALFPEGTLIRDAETLGTPRRGAGRIAIATGTPIVPCAIAGAEKRRLPLPRRVQVAFGEPIHVHGFPATVEGAGDLIDEVVWPALTEDYHALRARPGLVAAGVAAVGLGFAVRALRKR